MHIMCCFVYIYIYVYTCTIMYYKHIYIYTYTYTHKCYRYIVAESSARTISRFTSSLPSLEAI